MATSGRQGCVHTTWAPSPLLENPGTEQAVLASSAGQMCIWLNKGRDYVQVVLLVQGVGGALRAQAHASTHLHSNCNACMYVHHQPASR